LGVIRPNADSVPRPLVAGSFLLLFPTLSPDGHWLAYSSNETGRDEVFVQPFPNASQGKWQVSTGGGTEPVWAHSGRELFYRGTTNNDIIAVDVTAIPGGAFRAGAPRVLFASGVDTGSGADERQYAVTPDDRHFVIARSVGAAESELMVVQGFIEELKRTVRR
jgi:hypothetical protein